jgi:hypothetical protein
MLIVVSSVVFGQMLGTSPGESDQTIAPSTANTAQPIAGSRPTAAAVATTTVDERPSLVATAEDSCRLLNLRLTTATSAAAVSLAQWQKHIDAMNLLVAGKISWAVATTFWDQTRVAAIENVAAFRAADKAAAASEGTTCKRLTPELVAGAVAGQADAIAACAESVTAKGSVIKQARTAVSTWEHHVHDMEALRRGDITPKQATAAWLKSWKTGAAQLNAYDAAQQRAAASRCTLT